MHLKIFILLVFSLAVDTHAYAGQNSLSVDYPASQGTYSQITLVKEGTNPDCTQSANNGTLFIDNGNGTGSGMGSATTKGDLTMCVQNQGMLTGSSSLKNCFNRFCSASGPINTPTPCSLTNPPGCPTTAGYSQLLDDNKNPIADTFYLSTSSGTFWVTSIVCCGTDAS